MKCFFFVLRQIIHCCVPYLLRKLCETINLFNLGTLLFTPSEKHIINEERMSRHY